MAKIARYDGNLEAFGSDATGTLRTVFGDTATSDTLDDNINADFLTGWEVVTINDAPPIQWFNALGFTTTQILAYLHQMGTAEWNTAQEYHEGSIAINDGVLCLSLEDDNIGNSPATDYTKWKDISGTKKVVQTTDATVTAIATIPLAEDSAVLVEANVIGAIADYSAACGGFLRYIARRAGAGAVEISPPIVDVLEDSTGSAYFDADVDGNNIRLLVTGVTAETWNWSCSYKISFIA
jgi:hypothetical protein